MKVTGKTAGKLAKWGALLGLLSTLHGIVPSGQAEAAGNVKINVNLAAQGPVMDNKHEMINVWDFRIHWTSEATGRPASYFATQYPFVKNVQFMTATGGSAERDLFVNPNDRSTMTDYKFDELLTALHNVVDQGLKPFIKTGAVPLKFTANPHISSAFGVNVRPPDNYDVYYNYIKAIADAVVAEFGINEVKTWTWGVLTEYENADWFIAADGSPNTTKIAYFKLYDYTVAALEAAIGANNLNVGAHSMSVINALWDERDFIDHVATGTNYKTGAIGTQIDYLAASYYDGAPGVGSSGNSFADTINLLRDKAHSVGLTNLKFGIDEGRILNGPGDDNRALFSRIVAHSYQGTYDAKLFKIMNDSQIDYLSTWGLSTEAFWGGVTPVSTHIANLTYKMVGDHRVGLAVTGSAADPANEIDGVASFNRGTNTVHVMTYNHNPNMNANVTETPTLTIDNIAPVSGNTVTVKQWIVDDTHGNFWQTWVNDVVARGMQNTAYSWSKYSMEVPKYLVHASDRNYWYSRESVYKALATITPTTTTATVTGNKLVLQPTLTTHGVVFYEITNATNTVTTTPMTDDLNDWSKTYAHSSGLAFDTANASVLGDNSRVTRKNTNATPAEHVIYKYPGIRSFSATGLFATHAEAINNFKLYTSPNGTTWTQQTGWTSSDAPINGGDWTRRVYTLSSVPAGTEYVKVEFPTGGALSYSPQLSKVNLNYVYNHVVNPSFEDNTASVQSPSSWYTTGKDLSGDYTEGGAYNGSYKLVHWKNAPYETYTYQTMTGLSNGLYTLKAWVKNDYGGLGTAYMQAKDYGGSGVTTNIPTASAWTQISIPNINVTNGQCTIGFYSNSPASRWYYVDQVEFVKQ
ncbi:putative T9SS C-terminal target domain-containing protein [Paenibacillus sp. 598K]|uniref:GH39 family glycosyl hydrolase n=1 Tax=Paenibacillus sp. 598K TaxID=1117987 RepID=UPI000FF93EF2|nr:hypothetical protein [Paenibacillus sp. 598K]GBF77439.1 putative T9SS C-terminal target domain-containing protein [Paenibacillus sp. 598K]